MVRETGNTTSTQGVSALAHQQSQKYATRHSTETGPFSGTRRTANSPSC